MFTRSCLQAAILVALLAVTTAFAQDKDKKAKDEKHTFRVETDSGRYGFSADKLDAQSLGVAQYPGATVAQEDNNEGKGASLTFDWGRDSVKLHVQKYLTQDSPEPVLAFYRKQLAKYGPVLECREGKAFGSVPPGLKCEDDKDDSGTELRAGSEGRQHIVGVSRKDGKTEIGVVYLEKTKRGAM